SLEAGSLARPRAEECAIFPSCRTMAALIAGWRWPWRLVQMDELASRYSRPRASRSTAPWPETMTIGSRLRQSRICVKGCQRNWRSNCAREGKSGLGDKVQGTQGREQLSDIVPAVGRGQRQPQPRLPACDRRKADGGDEDALVEQSRGDLHRFALVSNHQRDDGAAFAIDD